MPRFVSVCALVAALYAGAFLPDSCAAGGVTIITHGLNGNVDGWVTGMANQIANYPHLSSTNVTVYRAYFFSSGGSYALTWQRTAGPAPYATDTGEIIVKLDWSVVANGNSWNTYQVAAVTASNLLSTSFISELSGHALAEFPLHFIGHSRGGSLICELSRQLGTNGIWVDHLSTLDPHPLNNDGFNDFIYSATDAPAKTYANVLFHDNTWQKINSLVHGEAVSGAYVRQLTSLSGGGYSGFSAEHSDVHLWYHGTIDWKTPTSDTEAGITNTQRQTWWTSYEQQGTNAGFLYSLIGGGNRLSIDTPTGAGAIRDGYNQQWNLGAGTASNRTALTTNTGAWPSLIRLNRATTNAVVQGQGTALNLYYQWARPASSNATLSVYLDNDFNPLNSNQSLLAKMSLTGTTGTNFGFVSVPLTLAPTNSTPGLHSLYAVVNAGTATRLMYAPELLQIIPAPPPSAPTLDISFNATPLLGINGASGETIVLESSSNLFDWTSIATNTLSSNRWLYAEPVNAPARFYRAFLVP